MKRTFFPLLLLISILISACGSSDSAQSAQNAASAYIENKGSDTIVNLALAWAERTRPNTPMCSISVTGGGSGTGIAALINGTVDIANASRQINAEEVEAGRGEGHRAGGICHRPRCDRRHRQPGKPGRASSPSSRFQIFTAEKSTTGAKSAAKTGPSCACRARPTPGRTSTSSKRFCAWGIRTTRLSSPPNTLLLPSSEGIIDEVRQNPNAIGYDGLGYVPKDLKMIAIAEKAGEAYVLPSVATVNDKTYAVSRDLYMYTAGEANGAYQRLPGLDRFG